MVPLSQLNSQSQSNSSSNNLQKTIETGASSGPIEVQSISQRGRKRYRDLAEDEEDGQQQEEQGERGEYRGSKDEAVGLESENPSTSTADNGHDEDEEEDQSNNDSREDYGRARGRGTATVATRGRGRGGRGRGSGGRAGTNNNGKPSSSTSDEGKGKEKQENPTVPGTNNNTSPATTSRKRKKKQQSDPTNTDAPNPNSSNSKPSNPKPKRSRTPRACLQCRKQKARCEVDESSLLLNGLNGFNGGGMFGFPMMMMISCHRCKVLGIVCSFSNAAAAGTPTAASASATGGENEARNEVGNDNGQGLGDDGKVNERPWTLGMGLMPGGNNNNNNNNLNNLNQHRHSPSPPSTSTSHRPSSTHPPPTTARTTTTTFRGPKYSNYDESAEGSEGMRSYYSSNYSTQNQHYDFYDHSKGLLDSEVEQYRQKWELGRRVGGDGGKETEKGKGKEVGEDEEVEGEDRARQGRLPPTLNTSYLRSALSSDIPLTRSLRERHKSYLPDTYQDQTDSLLGEDDDQSPDGDKEHNNGRHRHRWRNDCDIDGFCELDYDDHDDDHEGNGDGSNRKENIRGSSLGPLNQQGGGGFKRDETGSASEDSPPNRSSLSHRSRQDGDENDDGEEGSGRNRRIIEGAKAKEGVGNTITTKPFGGRNMEAIGRGNPHHPSAVNGGPKPYYYHPRNNQDFHHPKSNLLDSPPQPKDLDDPFPMSKWRRPTRLLKDFMTKTEGGSVGNNCMRDDGAGGGGGNKVTTEFGDELKVGNVVSEKLGKELMGIFHEVYLGWVGLSVIEDSPYPDLSVEDENHTRNPYHHQPSLHPSQPLTLLTSIRLLLSLRHHSSPSSIPPSLAPTLLSHISSQTFQCLLTSHLSLPSVHSLQLLSMWAPLGKKGKGERGIIGEGSAIGGAALRIAEGWGLWKRDNGRGLPEENDRTKAPGTGGAWEEVDRDRERVIQGYEKDGWEKTRARVWYSLCVADGFQSLLRGFPYDTAQLECIERVLGPPSSSNPQALSDARLIFRARLLKLMDGVGRLPMPNMDPASWAPFEESHNKAGMEFETWQRTFSRYSVLTAVADNKQTPFFYAAIVEGSFCKAMCYWHGIRRLNVLARQLMVMATPVQGSARNKQPATDSDKMASHSTDNAANGDAEGDSLDIAGRTANGKKDGSGPQSLETRNTPSQSRYIGNEGSNCPPEKKGLGSGTSSHSNSGPSPGVFSSTETRSPSQNSFQSGTEAPQYQAQSDPSPTWSGHPPPPRPNNVPQQPDGLFFSETEWNPFACVVSRVADKMENALEELIVTVLSPAFPPRLLAAAPDNFLGIVVFSVALLIKFNISILDIFYHESVDALGEHDLAAALTDKFRDASTSSEDLLFRYHWLLKSLIKLWEERSKEICHGICHQGNCPDWAPCSMQPTVESLGQKLVREDKEMEEERRRKNERENNEKSQLVRERQQQLSKHQNTRACDSSPSANRTNAEIQNPGDRPMSQEVPTESPQDQQKGKGRNPMDFSGMDWTSPTTTQPAQPLSQPLGSIPLDLDLPNLSQVPSHSSVATPSSTVPSMSSAEPPPLPFASNPSPPSPSSTTNVFKSALDSMDWDSTLGDLRHLLGGGDTFDFDFTSLGYNPIANLNPNANNASGSSLAFGGSNGPSSSSHPYSYPFTGFGTTPQNTSGSPAFNGTPNSSFMGPGFSNGFQVEDSSSSFLSSPAGQSMMGSEYGYGMAQNSNHNGMNSGNRGGGFGNNGLGGIGFGHMGLGTGTGMSAGMGMGIGSSTSVDSTRNRGLNGGMGEWKMWGGGGSHGGGG